MNQLLCDISTTLTYMCHKQRWTHIVANITMIQLLLLSPTQSWRLPWHDGTLYPIRSNYGAQGKAWDFTTFAMSAFSLGDNFTQSPQCRSVKKAKLHKCTRDKILAIQNPPWYPPIPFVLKPYCVIFDCWPQERSNPCIISPVTSESLDSRDFFVEISLFDLEWFLFHFHFSISISSHFYFISVYSFLR